MKYNKNMRFLAIIIAALAMIVAIVLPTVVSCSANRYELMANRIKSKKKVVMLTFDDGPLNFNTKEGAGIPGDSDYDPNYDKPYYTIDDEILDILKANSKYSVDGKPIPATFFEVGSHIHLRTKYKNFTRTMTRIMDSGSWIGSHTYNHDHYKKKGKKFFFNDIRESYDEVDKFYKEYFTEKHDDSINPLASEVGTSKKSIAKLNITKKSKTDTVDIPLRLGYLQGIPWSHDFRKELGIKTVIYGSFGTDWNETKNATPEAISKYFEQKGWGDYGALKKKYYAKDTDKTASDMKEFAKHESTAKIDISKKVILDYYKNLMSKKGSNGQIIVCHTRTFAKYWLNDLIKWLHDNGYQFAGMNPYNKNSYYKNWGKLIN